MPSKTPKTHKICQQEIASALRQKIRQYKQRQWIDDKEEQRLLHYLAFSSVDDSSPKAMDKSLRAVQKWLRAIKEGRQKDDRDDTKAKKEKKRNTIVTTDGQDNEQLQKKLIATINVYKQRQWIDETEENGLRSLLQSTEVDNFIPSSKALEAMEKRLLSIKSEHFKKDRKNKVDSQAKKKEDLCSKPKTIQNKNHWYKIHNAEDYVDELNYEVSEKLFTEMCVFARMRFLQPPSCMHCIFTKSQHEGNVESKEDNDEERPCQNLVIWRRDANISIHPNMLDGNLLVISCAAAKLLMQNEMIQGQRWDKKTNQVVQTEIQ
jgi:hypothetical protein